MAGRSVWKGGIGSTWKGKVCLGLVACLLTFFVYGRNRGVIIKVVGERASSQLMKNAAG